jgi:hypothetical protein
LVAWITHIIDLLHVYNWTLGIIKKWALMNKHGGP